METLPNTCFYSKKLDNTDSAIIDFEKSITLLPTVEAYYSLGEYSLANNQKDHAIDYFWEAWTQETPLGIEAGKIVARLDLEKNPKRYIDTSVHLSDAQNIIIYIQNNSELSVELKKINLLKWKSWKQEIVQTYSINEIIKPGEGLNFVTLTGPIKRKKLIRYSAEVIQARISE